MKVNTQEIGDKAVVVLVSEISDKLVAELAVKLGINAEDFKVGYIQLWLYKT